VDLKNINYVEVENYKHVQDEDGLFLVRDFRGSYRHLNYLNSLEDYQFNREVSFFTDSSNNLIQLESNPVVLATTKDAGDFHDGHKNIVFHPRYALSLEDITLLIIKGFANGRTLDILLPGACVYQEDQAYSLLNIKGVGAHALEPLQVEQNSWFNRKEGKFVPFESIMDKSLGRRWGLIDTYEATREYKNNLFNQLGLPQVPHISLNEVPEDIFPFKGTSQLVRGIKTNVRLDDIFLISVPALQKYVDEEKITDIDKKYFEVQKELAKENKQLISVMGRIANNRYIDGAFTDMENYAIKTFKTREDLLKKATSAFMNILGCGYLSLSLNDEKRDNYLTLLENKTGIKFTKFKDKDPDIFLDMHLSKEDYAPYRGELPKMYGELKPMVQEYLFS
jgi:hypothetical protein